MGMIDADELREHQFHGCYTNIHIASKTDAYMLGWNDAINAVVECAPTVDAVPVVRCKDCKHYWKNEKDSVSVCLASPKDDAFCSEGERREDE